MGYGAPHVDRTMPRKAKRRGKLKLAAPEQEMVGNGMDTHPAKKRRRSTSNAASQEVDVTAFQAYTSTGGIPVEVLDGEEFFIEGNCLKRKSDTGDTAGGNNKKLP